MNDFGGNGKDGNTDGGLNTQFFSNGQMGMNEGENIGRRENEIRSVSKSKSVLRVGGKLTPMMKQYLSIKEKYPDCILFFRLGDFYEMFFDDALEASKILQITLTARNKGENKTPMCGVPYHASEQYIAKLTRAGRKVAVCEQLSDPNDPGIVQRDVVRIVTPGTTLDENVLEGKANNYVMAIVLPEQMRVGTGNIMGGGDDVVFDTDAVGKAFVGNVRAEGDGAVGDLGSEIKECPEELECTKKLKDKIGLAYADLTTGEFKFTDITNEYDLRAEIERVNPAEVVVPDYQFDSELISQMRGFFEGKHFFPYSVDNILRDTDFALTVDALLSDYLRFTQKQSLHHVDDPAYYEVDDYMPLDEATLKNLELLETLREGKKEGSLLWVLDRTVTSMGGRLLRHFLTHPLVDKKKIDLRLDAVAELVEKQRLLDDLRGELKEVMDLERLLARLSLGRGNARDLIGLKLSLEKIPVFRGLMDCTSRGLQGGSSALLPSQSSTELPVGVSSDLLVKLCAGLNPMDDIVSLIGRAIVDEPPLAVGDGGIIADGFDFELDELRAISREGKGFIQGLQKDEAVKTGISNLKVRYNKVFGYYIEVSKGNVGKVPESYIRKQTLVNAERYITPELKEFEAKVLGAEEKIVKIEERIFGEVREAVILRIKEIKRIARLIALLDVMCSNARSALANDYCRPVVSEFGGGSGLRIIGGRHPVVEKMSANNSFVANDLVLGGADDVGSEEVGGRDEVGGREYIHLITGPNMGGKSTFLRQTALIVLMAQTGSFVPANEAHIELCDRIFTRVGASDNLVRGQSTFMVEMSETAYILANATERSLIILDEVGRGTSTYDGMSIAWSILEYLHDKVRAKTLFATHYHELISLTERLEGARNYAVAVKEKPDEGIVFLYKIREGGVDRSYGIEVAKLAGLPAECLERARHILVDLEEGVVEKGIEKELGEVAKDKHLSDFGMLGALNNLGSLGIFGLLGATGDFGATGKKLGKLEEWLPERDLAMQADEGLGYNEIGEKCDELSGEENILKRSHRSIVRELKELDINAITPIQALNKLVELKNQYGTN